MSDDLIPIDGIARLDLKPGDIVAIMVKGKLSPQTAERIRQMWNERFANHPAIILEEGTTLAIIRPTKEPAGE